MAKGSLRLVRCSRCGMVFANPVEEQYLTGTFYDQLATPFYLSPQKLESDYAPVRFRRELRLFRRYCRSGDVLDVGCSTGAFLHQLTQRFDGAYRVLGVDVAGAALDHAEGRRIPVLRGSFLELDFGARRFDAITFWAVLEHVPEPRMFLARAAALLKPGGYCFVLVPNMESLAVRWLGRRYRYIMPEHLNYFRRDTFRRLFDREPALEVQTLRSMHFNPAVIWQDRRRRSREFVPPAERARLLQRTTAWKQSALLLPLCAAYALTERFLATLSLADNLVVVARRNVTD